MFNLLKIKQHLEMYCYIFSWVNYFSLVYPIRIVSGIKPSALLSIRMQTGMAVHVCHGSTGVPSQDKAEFKASLGYVARLCLKTEMKQQPKSASSLRIPTKLHEL